MEEQEKLDLVVNYIAGAVKKAGKPTFFTKTISIERSNLNGLDKIQPVDLGLILQKLEEEEKVIRVFGNEGSFRKRTFGEPTTPEPRKFGQMFSYEPDKPLTVGVFNAFDNWYAAYSFKRNRKLSDLPEKLFKAVHALVEDIYHKFQAMPATKLVLLEKRPIEETGRGDALDYLQDNGILNSKMGYESYTGVLSVEIDLKVDKFLKFREELLNILQPDRKRKFPKNIEWSDVFIKFLDGHNVKIKVKDVALTANFKELGFEDQKKRTPNKQWELLEELSQNDGQITWGDSAANDKIKKRKQTLSNILKEYFQIEDDPFYPYQDGRYKIKLKLAAE